MVGAPSAVTPKQELERQVELAELRKKLAELAKQTEQSQNEQTIARRGLFTGSTLTPLSGDLTSSNGTFIESRVLVHRLISNTVNSAIVSHLLTQNKLADGHSLMEQTVFVVCSPADVVPLGYFADWKVMLTRFVEDYKSVEAEMRLPIVDVNELGDSAVTARSVAADPLLLPMAVTGLLKSVAEGVQLFRQTNELLQSETLIDESTLVAMLVKWILERKPALPWQVYHPAAFPVQATTESRSELAELLVKLVTLHARTTGTIKGLEAQVQLLTKVGGETDPAAEQQVVTLTRAAQLLASWQQTSQQLLTELMTVNPATGSTLWQVLQRTERLRAQLTQPNTYGLIMRATGWGTNKISRSLWRSARVSHSAGGELTYQLVNASGWVVSANSVNTYVPFMQSKAI